MMELSEFEIGKNFCMSGKRYRCTDIGTRCVVAIELDLGTVGFNPRTNEETLHMTDAKSWFNGPPYAVLEKVFDEYDLELCHSIIDDWE